MVSVRDFEKLGGHVAIYGGTSILRKLVGLLLLPVYMRLLTPSDYGVLEIASIATSLFTTLVLFQMPWSMSRSYLYEAKDEREKANILGAGAAYLLIACAVFIVAGFAVVRPASVLLFKGSGYTGIGALVVANVAGSCLLNFRMTHCRNLKQPKTFSVISLSSFITSLVLTLVFVVKLEWGAFGALLGSALGLLAVNVAFVPWFMRAVRIGVDVRRIKEMLKLAAPLVPSGVALWVLMASDRFFLQRFHGLDYAGYYALANKLVLPLAFLTEAFRLAWNPMRYEYAKDADGPKMFGQVLTLLVLVFLGGILVVWALGPLAIRILTPERYGSGYGIGSSAIPFLALSHLFYAVTAVTGVGLVLAKKTQYHLVFYGLAAALNVGLNLVLVPRFDLVGASGARAAAFLLATVGCTAVSLRYFDIRFEKRRLLTAFGVFGALMAGLALQPSGGPLFETGYRVLMVVLYIPALLALGFLTPEEKELAKKLVGWKARSSDTPEEPPEDGESI